MKKNVFKLVDPAIWNRKAIKIQRFIRYVMLRIKGKKFMKEMKERRMAAAKRIQIFYRYKKMVGLWRKKNEAYKKL
jgi:hypothetical protein